MSILARWSGALVRDPLVWYGKHGEGDVRHLAMNSGHILALFATYRAALPARLSAADRIALLQVQRLLAVHAISVGTAGRAGAAAAVRPPRVAQRSVRSAMVRWLRSQAAGRVDVDGTVTGPR